jgi:DeoR/GlpR family transcriptional regulator of sugar metabolism
MRANRVIVVADTSKFGAEAAVVITALDAVTTIVTGGLPADTVKRLGPWNLQLVQT